MNNETRQNGNSIGVVLFQLGGPDSPEAIEPFLHNLFSDSDIIDFPFARLARPLLARLISSRRANHVREHYARIGGKSPLRELTERQATALEAELRKTIDARVFVAMRYWHPLTDDTVRQIETGSFGQLVLLPLYPQYSSTTTGSSLNEWRRRYSGPPAGGQALIKIIPEFHNHSLYIDAVVERINLGLQRLALRGRVNEPAAETVAGRPGPAIRDGNASTHDVHLVFSAHGVPMSVIEAGDPYQAQVEATTKLVMQRGGWPNSHYLCYQSRVGPGKWLEPSLGATLRTLAAQGAQRALVIPIAFVSDHFETLHEINIEARELAGTLGIRQFETMPALNDSPKFIRALAELVLREVERPETEVRSQESE